MTIDYKGGPNGETTGSLKIVVVDETQLNLDTPENGLYPDTGLMGLPVVISVLGNQSPNLFRSVYWTINKTDSKLYPLVWQYARYMLAKWLTSRGMGGATAYKDSKIWDCSSLDSIKIVRYAKEFYDNMKTAMPGLMSYRYQN